MLVVLPHGVCVDPEIVKFFNVRTERKGPTGQPLHTVVLKTDEEHLLIIGSSEDREEAETLSVECARRINRALGEEETEAADEVEPEEEDLDDDDDDDW